jgi:hypothetical protein
MNLQEFFAANPQANEIYEALGHLFETKEGAERFLGGVIGYEVITHTRPAVEVKTEDEIEVEIEEKIEVEEKIEAKEETPAAPIVETKATTYDKPKRTRTKK